MRVVATSFFIACLFGEAWAAAPNLTHTSAVHPPPVRANKMTTLYDQTGHDSGTAIPSQNFEDEFDIYDDVIADDFAVPEGTRWKIKEIDIEGTYFDGTGPAHSLNIAVYRNKDGLPGKPVVKYDAIEIADDHFGSFVVSVPRGLTLRPGRYWISVQANLDFSVEGEWGWETAQIVVDNPALFQNPGDGFATGCVTWTPVKTCIPQIEGDMIFALRGKSVPEEKR